MTTEQTEQAVLSAIKQRAMRKIRAHGAITPTQAAQLVKLAALEYQHAHTRFIEALALEGDNGPMTTAIMRSVYEEANAA